MSYMRKTVAAVLLIAACSFSVSALFSLVSAAENTLGVFGAGFSAITDSGATFSFTTSMPAKATITVTGENESDRVSTSEQYNEIHRHDLENLTKNKEYTVAVTVQDETGETVESEEHILVPRSREPDFAQKRGVTLFGSNHVDDVSLIEEAGLKVFRFPATWANLFPQRNELNEDYLRKLNEKIDALKSNDIEPLIVLDYCVDWAQKFTDQQVTYRNSTFGPPDHLADWDQYVRFVMNELKGRVHYFEVWNEPDAGYLATAEYAERPDTPTPEARELYKDNDEYWIGDRYVPMVIRAREIADEVDPSIILLNGGWNRDYGGSSLEICRNRGMIEYINIYCMHHYGGGSFARWHNSIDRRYMSNAEQNLGDYRDHIPMAVTEWGVRVNPNPSEPDPRMASSQRGRQLFLLKSVFYYLQTERMHILVMHTLGNFDDAREDPDPFGLVYRDLEDNEVYLPGYHTYQWLSSTFGAKPYTALGIETDNSENCYAYALQLDESGEIYVALWQDKFDKSTKSFTALENKNARVRLNGVRDVVYRKTSLDLNGEELTHETVSAAGGELQWDDTIPGCESYDPPGVRLYKLSTQSSGIHNGALGFAPAGKEEAATQSFNVQGRRIRSNSVVEPTGLTVIKQNGKVSKCICTNSERAR